MMTIPCSRVSRRPRVLVLAALAALVLAPGCDEVASGPGGAQAGSGAVGRDANAPARDVRDLVTALTPPPADSIPVVKSEYYQQRKRTLERMRGAGAAHGREALRVLRDEPPDLPDVRAGLLDVAAHTAPEATEALLVELTTTFGDDMLLRKRACELLGATRPERAVEVLEPILLGDADGRTYPPEDTLLEAWTDAMEQLGRDPVPLLALVGTDLQRTQDVRHLATRALGRHDTPLARQALETLLVESSGNGYIRRLALQSLRELLPQAEFCELAKRVQSNEADPEMIVFLQSALDLRCR
jgi:HEAT repeat protein